VPVQLKPGLWQLTIVGQDAKGVKTTPVSRRISVQYTGVNVQIDVKGGNATIYVIRDGRGGLQVAIGAGRLVNPGRRQELRLYKHQSAGQRLHHV